jgi:hypothetical protein
MPDKVKTSTEKIEPKKMLKEEKQILDLELAVNKQKFKELKEKQTNLKI